MPLIKSKSKGAFKTNVRTLMGEIGKSPHVQSKAQALAIAYSTQRRGRAAGGRSGSVDPAQWQMDPLTTEIDRQAAGINRGGVYAGPGRAPTVTKPSFESWHASPHDFSKFDISKIGTGQGAGTYGAGIYTAQNPKVSGVGGEYWKEFARREQVGTPMYLAQAKLEEFGFDRQKALQGALREIKDWRGSHSVMNEFANPSDKRAATERLGAWERAAELLADPKAKIGPRVYRVRTNEDPNKFLDLDVPLKEQPNRKEIEKVVDRFGLDTKGEGGLHTRVHENTKGRDIYGTLAGRLAEPGSGTWDAGRASDIFNSSGVPGSRYLDAHSRESAVLTAQLQAARDALAIAREQQRSNWKFPVKHWEGRVAELEQHPQFQGKEPTRNFVHFNDDIMDIIDKQARGGLVRRKKAEGGPLSPPPIEPPAMPTGMDAEKLRRLMLMQRQIMQGRPQKFSGRSDLETGSLHDVVAPETAGRFNTKGWDAFLEQAPESQNIEDRRGSTPYLGGGPFTPGSRDLMNRLREERDRVSGARHQTDATFGNTSGPRPNLELLSQIAASMKAEGGRTPTQEELLDAARALAPDYIDKMKPQKPPPIKKAQGGYTNLSPPWYARHAMKGLGMSAVNKGFLNSGVAGRTDRLPLDVAPGSYVVPADIVSALGQGNSLAGAKMLKRMFSAPKMAAGGSVSASGSPIAQETPMYTQGGMNMNKYGAGRFRRPGIKGLRRSQYEMAEGGEAPQEDVPIVAAGGEFLLSPDEVAIAGKGDVDAGFNVLDAFVKNVRKEHIATLRKLKPPKKD